MPSLSSVCAVTLDKEANICTFWASLCRVSSIWHSAKNSGLPSVRSGTLGKRDVTVSASSHYFFLPSVGFSSRPIENTRQRDVCRHCRCRVLFAKCYTQQIFCRVFFGLCRVPVAQGKLTVSGGEYMPRHVSEKKNAPHTHAKKFAFMLRHCCGGRGRECAIARRHGVSCGRCCFYGSWAIFTNGSCHDPTVVIKIHFHHQFCYKPGDDILS